MVVLFFVFAAVFALILFCPVCFCVTFSNNKLKADCRILFLCFELNFFDRSSGCGHKRGGSVKCENFLHGDRRRGWLGAKGGEKIVFIVFEAIKSVADALKLFELVLVVGAADSASVAQRYGFACALTSFLFSHVFSKTGRKRRVRIVPDFSCESGFVSFFSCKFVINLFIIIRGAFLLFFRILKEGVFYERKTT